MIDRTINLTPYDQGHHRDCGCCDPAPPSRHTGRKATNNARNRRLEKKRIRQAAKNMIFKEME